MLKMMSRPALRALIAADKFQQNLAARPWPTTILSMISGGWKYPNGGNFRQESWALLAAHEARHRYQISLR